MRTIINQILHLNNKTTNYYKICKKKHHYSLKYNQGVFNTADIL